MYAISTLSALSPHAFNPTTPTQGHFVLSPVSLALRDQDDAPFELNDRHLRSHGKIGDCKQSIHFLKLKEAIYISRPLNARTKYAKCTTQQ